MVKGVRGVLFSILFANLKDERNQALLQFGLLHCLDWRNISACLSGIIAPLFPNLHTVVGVFKCLFGDPFIAKLFDLSSVLGGANCAFTLQVAVGVELVGSVVSACITSVGAGPDWCRTSNAATNIASMSSSVLKCLQKDKSSSLSKSLSSMTCASFSSVTRVKCC